MFRQENKTETRSSELKLKLSLDVFHHAIKFIKKTAVEREKNSEQIAVK